VGADDQLGLVFTALVVDLAVGIGRRDIRQN
jgi:hypothetical protein